MGDFRKSHKLRIGRYAQHFVDALEMDANPVEYLLGKFPEAGLKPEQMRAQLGRFGLSGHHHLQPICKLSGEWQLVAGMQASLSADACSPCSNCGHAAQCKQLATATIDEPTRTLGGLLSMCSRSLCCTGPCSMPSRAPAPTTGSCLCESVVHCLILQPGDAVPSAACVLASTAGPAAGQHPCPPNHAGGQKARVVFTSISLSNPHILLFDEPTNHLDMQSIDALADAIEKFEGGVIIISHDSQLLSR